jgi:hypothetical protein
VTRREATPKLSLKIWRGPDHELSPLDEIVKHIAEAEFSVQCYLGGEPIGPVHRFDEGVKLSELFHALGEYHS